MNGHNAQCIDESLRMSNQRGCRARDSSSSQLAQLLSSHTQRPEPQVLVPFVLARPYSSDRHHAECLRPDAIVRKPLMRGCGYTEAIMHVLLHLTTTVSFATWKPLLCGYNFAPIAFPGKAILIPETQDRLRMMTFTTQSRIVSFPTSSVFYDFVVQSFFACHDGTGHFSCTKCNLFNQRMTFNLSVATCKWSCLIS